MRALIVGAGSVGQVYGWHLQRGGAEVHVYVREKYAEEARAGWPMYRLNERNARSQPFRFRPDGVHTSAASVGAETFDQVWICVSSTGLRGDWRAPFLRACGEALIVSMQPGIDDRELLLEDVPEERLVSGIITFISYPGPLEGEVLPEPGTVYWLPPMTPSAFYGPPSRVAEVVRALESGGASAKHDPKLLEHAPFANALFMPFLSVLESEGWKLGRATSGAALRDVVAGVRQAVAIAAAARGISVPLPFRLLNGLAIKALVAAAVPAMPLDLEPYLELHFTKVGDQTRFFMQSYIERGRALGQPTDVLERLEAKVASMSSRSSTNASPKT